MEVHSIGGTFFTNVTEGLRNLWAALTLAEISGAFGDIGTFVPLLVALVRVLGLDLGTTLIFTGLYNIASGALFGIPMPVQPMKAIAAIALADQRLTLAHIVAAGVFVSACTFILGITRLINFFNWLIPDAVVRGLQLSVGLGLAQRGIHNVWFKAAEEKDLRIVPDESNEKDICVYLGLAATAFLLVMLYPSNSSAPTTDVSLRPAAQLPPSGAAQEPTMHRKGSGRARLTQSPNTPSSDAMETSSAGSEMRRNRESSASLNLWLGMEGTSEPAQARKTPVQDVARRLPAALLVVFVGIVAALVQYPMVLRALRLGPNIPRIILPTLDEWKHGIIWAGLPQLPLTTLNSVVAVCQLSADLFPLQPARPTLVASSVGAMNLVGAWLGAMPCCHGAGGLAAQVRFGAKTGAAPVFLGVVKLVLGLAFGSSLYQLLKAFPQPLLGSLMLFSGVELAASCGRAQGERGAALMLITAATGMALGSTAIGFLAGMASAAILAFWDAAPGWVSRSGVRIRNALDRLPSSSTPDSSHHAGTHYQALPAEGLPVASASRLGPSDDIEYWGPPRHTEP